ncbi:MAG: hypothetical protein KC549_07805 [Myxococcales bacterium]|nr:hypothetical protein [Myxococcales bacterium]MCB9548601.1 hypothetical protein [Myxococcales bacterium]
MRLLRRGEEKTSTLRRVGCTVQLVAAILGVGLVITLLHARSLMRYGPTDQPALPLDQLATLRRIGVFLGGQQLPRPVNRREPASLELLSRRVELPGDGPNPRLDAWFLQVEQPEGLALVFHDYGQSKADMLEVAASFHDLRYAVLLTDLRASGDSEGLVTSFGWFEADDVARVALRANDFRPAGGRMVLYGLGTGAAAVMRAVADLGVAADGVVLEAPYADLRDFFSARVARTGMIAWPVSRVSLFWAGNSLEFPAAELVPQVIATRVKVPAVVVAGGELTEDDLEAARAVAQALPGSPTLQVVPGAGKPAVLRQGEAWFEVINAFVGRLPPPAGASAAAPVQAAPQTLPDMPE